jgi:demethylspheroidene O-methyltransferase
MIGPQSAASLGAQSGMTEQRMALLLKAAAGIGIVKLRRDNAFALTRQGAALVGVPGLQDMILHHGAFYRDMADPVGLLNGDRETELSAFWPYVFGAGGATDPEVTDRYSNLMAETQAMVARDTLQAVSLKDVSCLMDVGGGNGAFLIEAGQQNTDMDLILFDLPVVMESAKRRVASAGMTNRITLAGGSFRDDPLPDIADAISLVRVLYDHSDDTVLALLQSVHEALPPGGRLIISEPMSGGDAPDPITDVYFAFYTLAMRTGRTRSSAEIAELVKAAGFNNIETPRTPRSFVTSVLTANRS